MQLTRRHFNTQLLAAAPLALCTGAAQAQGQPVEGQHYARLKQSVPVTLPAGKKVEVVEFFWYGCPHCHALEPVLHAWAKQLPADVLFRRVPVAFGAIHETHGRIYYALEALGALDSVHPRVFAAIHNGKQRLDKDADITAFMAANGLDAAKFSEAYKSFGVITNANKGKALANAYRIDSVPTLGINGRFTTSAGMAGSNEGALKVVDFLANVVRKG